MDLLDHSHFFGIDLVLAIAVRFVWWCVSWQRKTNRKMKEQIQTTKIRAEKPYHEGSRFKGRTTTTTATKHPREYGYKWKGNDR